MKVQQNDNISQTDDLLSTYQINHKVNSTLCNKCLSDIVLLQQMSYNLKGCFLIKYVIKKQLQEPQIYVKI